MMMRNKQNRLLCNFFKSFVAKRQATIFQIATNESLSKYMNRAIKDIKFFVHFHNMNVLFFVVGNNVNNTDKTDYKNQNIAACEAR
jgi:hypothetical protein